MSEAVLKVRNLKTYFYTEEGVLPGVDGLDFDLERGGVLAIVGESGCGKSVTSLSILRIVQSPPGKIIDGEILYDGKDLLKLSEREMRRIRGNDISMIFQEPMTSLNPVLTVGQHISESLILHQKMDKKQARARSIEMLTLVGIPTPERVVDEYPHQLSGGMRQRVMIAMALACNPKILIADEPTTALDVTIQAQILRLITDLKNKLGTSVILITHDLGVVAETAEQVMVMYAGEAVEYGDVHTLFKKPLHPYTEGLLKSVPVLGSKTEKLYNIPGTVPSPKDYPKGCRFAPRCAYASERCQAERPPLYDMPDGRRVRCFRYKGGVCNE